MFYKQNKVNIKKIKAHKLSYLFYNFYETEKFFFISTNLLFQFKF